MGKPKLACGSYGISRANKFTHATRAWQHLAVYIHEERRH